MDDLKNFTVLRRVRYDNCFAVNNIVLENIIFYNSTDGILYQTNQGWFKTIYESCNSFDRIILNGECHNRRKVNLSKNEIFICSKELYIPMDYIKNFRVEKTTKEYDTLIHIFDTVYFTIDNKDIVTTTNYTFKPTRKGELYKKLNKTLGKGYFDYDLEKIFKYYKENREELEEIFNLV